MQQYVSPSGHIGIKLVANVDYYFAAFKLMLVESSYKYSFIWNTANFILLHRITRKA